MAKVFIGIDPGVSGAITALDENGKVFALTKMPQTMGDLLHFLQQFTNDDALCYLEKVHAHPGDGAVSVFKCGQGFGWLQMALLAAKVKTIEVLPNTWMRGLGIKSKKKDETKTAYKNRLKFVAEQLFPDQKVTLWNSDALLIAHSVFVADKKGEVVDNLEG